MRLAGEGDRAARLEAGQIPEGDDFRHYAAHIGGAIRVIALGLASVQGPSSFGDGGTKLVIALLEEDGVMHAELLETHMQGELSQAWPSKALVIRPPDVMRIALGLKCWELRSRPTHFRGTIAIAEAGTGRVLARAKITASLQLDTARFEQNEERHCVSHATLPTSLQNKPLYAWVLDHVVPAETPYLTIPVGLRQGPVAMINLPDGAVDPPVTMETHMQGEVS